MTQELEEINVQSIVSIVAFGIVALLLATMSIYRIDTGQGAILTSSNGEKIPIIGIGWHTKMPFLSSVNSFSVVNNNIYFPADYLVLESKFQGDQQSGAIGFDIKTTDDKVVDTGAVMSYEITDMIQFGVKNTNPSEQLQKAFDAVVFNYLQSQSSDKITTKITEVNEELLQKLKESKIEEQFGIKVNTFSLLRPTFTKTALVALSEKQAIQAKSEGDLNAAKNQAEGIVLIAKAQKEQADILANIPSEQLDFNAKLTLYNNLKGQPNVIWVIPTGQPITIQK